MTDSDAATCLLGTNEFVRDLRHCLYQEDKKWVLAMLNIDGLKKINDTKGYTAGDEAISNIGKDIKQFCNDSPNRLKGYKCEEGGKGDLFGVLVYCQKDYSFAQRNLNRLIKEIYKKRNISVSIGTGLIINTLEDTHKDWRQRAMDNLSFAKTNGGKQLFGLQDTIDKQKLKQAKKQSAVSKDKEKNKNKTTNNNNNKSNTNNNSNSSSEDDSNDSEELVGDASWDKVSKVKLPNKKHFDKKAKEIADSNDTRYVLALLDGDNIGKYKKEHGDVAAANQVRVIGKEISKLSRIFGDLCFGYKWGGDEYALLILNNNVKEWNLSEYIINTLMDNVRSECKVTISVGYTNLGEDELYREWFERSNNYLKQAKKNGKNQAFWGQTKRQLNIWQSLRKLVIIDDEKVDHGGSDKDNNSAKNGTDNSDTFENVFQTEVSYSQLREEVLKFETENTLMNSNKNFGDSRTCAISTCNQKQDVVTSKDNKGDTKNNNNNKHKNSDMYLCNTHRSIMANSLLSEAQSRTNKVSDRMRSIVINLMFNDEILENHSKNYDIVSDYFIHVYCYLKYEQLMITNLLTNNFIENTNQNMNENTFNLLFSTHLYLKEIVQILILLRACFYDFHLISVFFPLISEALGKSGTANLFGKIIDSSKLLVATNQTGDTNEMSFGEFAIKSIKVKFDESKLNNHQITVVQAIQDLGMFKNAIYDIFEHKDNSNTNNDGYAGMNPLDIVIHLENDLDSRINAIHTETQIKKSDVLLCALPTYDYLDGIEHKEDKIITKNDMYLIGELNDKVKKLLEQDNDTAVGTRMRGGSNSSHSSSTLNTRYKMHAIDYLIAGYLRRFEKEINKYDREWYIPRDLNQIFVKYMANGSKWDINSRNDEYLTVSQNGLRAFSTPFNLPPAHYVSKAFYSTIFIDNWLSKDGIYEFEVQMGTYLIIY